jgi:hypothetical protein
MDRERVIAMWYFHRRRKEKRRQQKRLHWVHPINQRREEVGLFHTLFEELRADENKFFNYFRMSASSFDELSALLKNSIQRQNTKMRNCIPPVQMLVIAIR